MMLSCYNKVFERERYAFMTKTCLFPCSSGPFCFSVHHRALRSNAIQITLQLHKPSHSSLFTSIERKCALRFLVFHYMSVSIYLAFAFIRYCSGRHFIHPYLVASSIPPADCCTSVLIPCDIDQWNGITALVELLMFLHARARVCSCACLQNKNIEERNVDQATLGIGNLRGVSLK